MPTVFGYVVGNPSYMQEIKEDEKSDEKSSDTETKEVNTTVLSDTPES